MDFIGEGDAGRADDKQTSYRPSQALKGTILFPLSAVPKR